MKHTPDQLNDWMDGNHLSAQEVANLLGRSLQTIRNWRSAGVPPRAQNEVQRMMDQRAKTPEQIAAKRMADMLVAGGTAIILRPTPEEHTAWFSAAQASGAITLEEWIVNSLNHLAECDQAHHQDFCSAAPTVPATRKNLGPRIIPAPASRHSKNKRKRAN